MLLIRDIPEETREAYLHESKSFKTDHNVVSLRILGLPFLSRKTRYNSSDYSVLISLGTQAYLKSWNTDGYASKDQDIESNAQQAGIYFADYMLNEQLHEIRLQKGVFLYGDGTTFLHNNTEYQYLLHCVISGIKELEKESV